MAFPVKILLGIIGNGTSLSLFLSPMFTFWRIYKAKSTKEYSSVPYIFTLFSCAFWILYGCPFVKPHSTLLLTISGAGFVLEMFYLVSFLIFAPKKTKFMTTMLTLAMTIAFGIVVVVTISVMHTHTRRQLVVGSMCLILSIVSYASPLSVVNHVIRTKNVDCMPFLLSLSNTINGMVWFGYSIVTRDVFLGVPTGIGFILGMIQLTIYFIYRNSKPVSSVSGELSEGKKIDDAFDPPSQIVERAKSNSTNVETVDPVIPDHV